ncbi:MAG: hypothetical protein SFY68_10380 [Candidatus Sumerlaeia bacterium]|nr:hypothetical protein [Candidatus Sumerlaeia bacterium]
MQRRIQTALSVIMVSMVVATGCTLPRSTTTTRTAIEQSLMSTSAKDSLSGLRAEVQEAQLSGKTFKIDDAALVSSDKDVIRGVIEQQLLAEGMKKAAENPEVVIVPVAEVSGIDDAEFLIGIPAIGVPTPGGLVGLPELALFKRSPQRGRNLLSLHGYEAKEGKGVLFVEGQMAKRHYVRHKFLLFFNYNNTNLPLEPSK